MFDRRMIVLMAAFILTAIFPNVTTAAEPVRLVFDTDLGNDVDDSMALAVIHALQNRAECELLAVTTTKDNPYVAPMTALLNDFYGRPEIPIAVIKDGPTPDDGKYCRQVLELKDAQGKARYGFDRSQGDRLPEAVAYLRKLLASQPDGGVVIAQVGFFTNLARLLDTPADDVSPLTGKELAAKKVKLLSLMAGTFDERKDYVEYNIKLDIPSARKVFADWPGEIVVSGHEVGRAIRHPGRSMRDDYNYVEHHPLQDAYRFYRNGFEQDQATYDLTSVLYAVRPDRGYFGLSAPGTVTISEKGTTSFEPSETGKHRYLTVTPEQIAMVREAFVILCSEPPKK